MILPSLRYLRRPHTCNYCGEVNGVVFDNLPKVRRRIMWVKCRCGKKHYVCIPCGRKIGSVMNGTSRFIAACAKGYSRKARAANSGTKGA